jgi:hypothetical protein
MPSFLRFVPKSSAAVPIDWSKIPENSKKYYVEAWAPYSESDEDTASEERSFPQTIGDLAVRFHEAKFFGYLGSELCQLLIDISKFGLKYASEQLKEPGLSVGPRFYMKYSSEVWFVLFSEEKEGAIGCSGKLPLAYIDEDEDWEAAEAENDREVAETFDKKLEDEVSRWGIIGVLASKRLAGWDAYTLGSSLEEAQFFFFL